MARAITIASGKGGVGKTTIVANLGIALAMSGHRVLLVDADVAMANLSLLFKMQNSPITLHEVLMGEASIDDAIYSGPKGVDLVPSGLSLESYRKVDSERLQSVIATLKDHYDFTLLDAPAGIERSVLSSLSAADQVLIVTTPNSPSIADALKTKIVAQRLGSKPFGFILNLMRGEKGELSKENVMKMLELPIYGIVPYDPEVRKTFLLKDAGPILLRNPNSPAAKAIQKSALKLGGKKVEIEEEKKGFFLTNIFKKLLGKK